MEWLFKMLLGTALIAPAAALAGSLQACPDPKLHYLLVNPAEELSGGADQEAFTALAKQTGAQVTVLTPDDFNVVAKDKFHQGHLSQLLANLKEIRHRIKTVKSERSLDGLIEQRERSLEEIHRFQADRKSAVREVLTATLKRLKAQDPSNKLILVYSGHGQRCSDGKEWCADLAPDQSMKESEWLEITHADAAIFDSSFMATGMELSAAPDKSRLLALTTAEWDAEEAGKGLISSALLQLMKGPVQNACAADGDRDGLISFNELSGFLAAAYAARPLASAAFENKNTDFCVARPVLKKCPGKMALSKLKFDRLFKHPEVLPPPPTLRAPASEPPTSLDKHH